jgi:putative oxidoreductase
MTFERQAAGIDEPRGIAALVQRVTAAIRAIAHPSLTQLALRIALAVPFWRSGINKWDGFLQLNDVAVLLFSSEFMLHLPGGPYPFPAPAMTIVVQLTVPDGWPIHLTWAAMALGVMAYGPGKLSLDHLLLRKLTGGA